MALRHKGFWFNYGAVMAPNRRMIGQRVDGGESVSINVVILNQQQDQQTLLERDYISEKVQGKFNRWCEELCPPVGPEHLSGYGYLESAPRRHLFFFRL